MRSASPRFALMFTCCLVSAPGRVMGETIAFEPAEVYPLGRVPEPLAVDDLNGDGFLDVVVANTAADGGPGGDNVSVLLGVGDGTFTHVGEFPVGGKRPEGVTLARVDGDAFPDAVTANFGAGENSISVLLGDGTGGFGAPIKTAVAGGPRFVVAADFDKDGFTDLATSNYENDTVCILKGDGTGSFTVTSTIPVGNGPEMLALARLTPDDDIDLITCDAIGDTITPLQGDGAGGFTAGGSHPVGLNPRFLLAADLNGDSLDDLIAANNDSNTVSLERNDGGLAFTNVNALSFSSSTITLKEPVYLDIADVNNDGDNDILVTWAASDVFTVFPQGSGQFDYDTPFAVQTNRVPLGIAAADFDEDGDLDVVVSNAEADTAHVYISHLTDPGVIVDNGNPGTRAIGPWSSSDAPFPFGASSLFSKNGTRYVFEVELPEAGTYEVFLWWTVTPERSMSIPVEIQHAAGSSSVLVDQTVDIGVWHSVGAYPFEGGGVVTIIAPQDNQSVSADAVRFRKLPTAPETRGRIPVAVKPRPRNFKIDSDTVLVFQGTLTADNTSESEDLLAAVFTPIGPGAESSKIAELKLFIDANGDGVFDPGDRQLGMARSFGSDIRAVVFDGFRETIPDGAAVDIFVVAEMMPPAVAQGEASGPTAGFALACGAGLAACLLLSRRRALFQLSIALAVALPFAAGAISGCAGGGGGGGGKRNLQIEMDSIVTEGSTTGTPSAYEGLPAEGWRF